MKSAVTNAWLRPRPDALPDRQVLVGDGFRAIETRAGWVRGETVKDAYAGWLPESALGAQIAPTHWVSVRTTWGFEKPDFKSAPMIDLHMTSMLQCTLHDDAWLKMLHGDVQIFVPTAHCKAMDDRAENLVEVARAFLGVPYVWAGNTGFGLDCSGLVQTAMRAAGQDCPADSHQQERMAGTKLANSDTLALGDLIFWKGHVAIASGPTHIIHANAHHMMVVEEPVGMAIDRISESDTGDVTSRLRPAR
ncbi:NlpC/P60 family protein [Rhodobacteraceae bacterium]|nr:NlpC/P60 family protein [Paracoccaceae bacterium]